MIWEGRDEVGWCARLGIPAVELHDAVPSTNARARVWVRDGAPDLSLVLAETQTAGKGRGGRRWLSPAGAGVWVTLVVPGRGLDRDALLPLRVGVALARRLEGISGCQVGVKWPNDLFLGDGGREGKVGGVLCERISVPEGGVAAPGERVLVGVGVNVLPVSVEADYPAAHLAALRPVARGEVLEAVAAAVREAADLPGAFLSPRERDAWAERDILFGRSVQFVAGEDASQRGVARGIDGEGRLRLEGLRGVEAVVAGSVRLLEAMDGGGFTAS